MIYLLTLEGKEHRAEIEKAGPGRYRVKLDGEEFAVGASRPEAAIYTLLMGTPGPGEFEGGEIIEADVEVSPDAVAVAIRGEKFEIGAIDERRKKLRAAAGQEAASEGAIRSPMPGKVVKILAAKGASVKRGDGVIVVEAMKMENQLTAPRDGVVKEIHIAEGQAVEAGALLVTIE